MPDARAVVARSVRIDRASIQKLRKDFLTLMKNVPRVRDYEEASTLREAFKVFHNRFNRVFFDEFINKQLKYDGSLPEVTRDWHNRELRKAGWDFYIELSLPLSYSDEYWSEEARFDQFSKARRKWENRLKGKARLLWKALDSFLEDVQRVTKQEHYDVPLTRVEQTDVEGFKVRVVGDLEDTSQAWAGSWDRFQEGLKIFRRRASKVFPRMLQMMLPIHAVVSGGLDEGGRYRTRYIEVYLSGFLTDKNPHRMAQVIAHEMGHHVWKAYLSAADRKFWDAAIRGNYGPLDVEKALRLWPQGAWLHEMPEKLKDIDPTLAVQLDLLHYGHGGAKQYDDREDFEQAIARGDKFIVPKNPITGYAGKNPEEAFCEALGMLIGYGPKTVDPLVKRWIQMILPNLRVAIIRRVAQRFAAEDMPDHQFWAIVGLMGWGSKTTDYKTLKNNLSRGLEGHQLLGLRLAYDRIYNRLRDVMERYFGEAIAHIGTGDDGYWDLLAHIIGLGEDEYRLVLANPQLAWDRAQRSGYTENFSYSLPRKDEITARVAARYKEKKISDKGNPIYLYSERQVALRNKKKAERIEKLGKALKRLRAQVKRDMKSSDPETRLTALAVALMDHTYERVGNDESASEGHFGVTGWQRKHMSFGSGGATIKYVGKSGVKQEKKITDTIIRKALKEAYDSLEGDDTCILSWDDGCVTAEKVNAYLKPFDATAKDIRGYHANEEMRTRLKTVRKGALPDDKKERDKQLKAEFKKALAETAKAVGHEPSTLKSQYLVPGLEDDYLKDGSIKTAALLTVERVKARYQEEFGDLPPKEAMKLRGRTQLGVMLDTAAFFYDDGRDAWVDTDTGEVGPNAPAEPENVTINDLPPEVHYRTICRSCGSVINQCRCSDPQVTLTLYEDTCAECDPNKRSTVAQVLQRFATDEIPGGLGDKKKPGDFDPKQIEKGIKVEMEHTNDRDLAREIAMDHLTEDPRYYDKLETIEKH